AAGETDLGACDAVLARIIPAGSLEQIIFRVDTLHALEAQGVPVMNSPRAIERTVDKLWTTATLAQAGPPAPQTDVCERPAAGLPAGRRTWRAAGGRVRPRSRGNARTWRFVQPGPWVPNTRASTCSRRGTARTMSSR